MAKKIKVIQGGQGAGKNISIAQILIEQAIEKKRIITVMSDTYKNLKDGAITDFKGQFESSELDWDKSFNKTDNDLKVNESIIQFRYITDTKADAGKSKRRDILYLNEGNKFGWEVASTYIGRTHEDVYIDYNPDFEFWAHTQIPKLRDKQGDSISEQIIVTFKDNEMCPESEVDFIESRKDNVSWYRVYGLGLTGFYSERMIYSYQFCDKIPDTAKRINSGLDYGVSPDPTALVDLYIDGVNLYADEVFCLNNLMPEKIAGAERMSIVDKMNEIKYPKGQLIIGDSSGRVSILDMRKHGYNVIAVKKYTGSVLDGIAKVKAYNLFITKRSINIKKGIESWFWKVDPNGKIIPEPATHEFDCGAAIRYAVMTYYAQ
jgi:phage terminase large subunit